MPRIFNLIKCWKILWQWLNWADKMRNRPWRDAVSKRYLMFQLFFKSSSNSKCLLSITASIRIAINLWLSLLLVIYFMLMNYLWWKMISFCCCSVASKLMRAIRRKWIYKFKSQGGEFLNLLRKLSFSR